MEDVVESPRAPYQCALRSGVPAKGSGERFQGQWAVAQEAVQHWSG